MKKWAVLVGVALALLVGAGWRYHTVNAANMERARQVLVRALGSGQEIGLEGIQRIEVAGMEPARARILRTADGKSRIEYLSGPIQGTRIWDNGELIWRWTPEAAQLTVAATRADDRAEWRESLILRNYEPRLVREETVAGHPAYVIDLVPKHAGNPWKRLWIGRENYAVLAATDFGPDNRELRTTRFEQVAFTPPATGPTTFQPDPTFVRVFGQVRPGDNTSSFSPQDLVDIVRFPVRLPAYVPPGYELEAGYPFPCEERHQAARLQYTDGLNTLVLLECGHNCPGEADCLVPGGSTALVVRHHANDVSVAATGELPRAELEKMVRSVPHARPVGFPKVRPNRISPSGGA